MLAGRINVWTETMAVFEVLCGNATEKRADLWRRLIARVIITDIV
jgi:hypothetical protein